MKKISISMAMFCLFFSANLVAQEDWTDMMRDHNAKFSDVKAAFNKWYSIHKPDMDNDKDAVKPGVEHEEDGNYLLFRRWEWFMHARTYPSGYLPDPAKVEKEYKDFLARQDARKNAHRAFSTTASWSYVGNVNIPSGGDAGRVNRVRIDPNNSKVIYACGPSGGLWKSTNGGTSWSTNTDQLLGLGTSDVAIDPTNSKIMYLATGDGDGIDGGMTTPSTLGVLKSTDGGATWNQTGLHYTLQTSGPSLMTVNELKINPNNTQVLLAATSFGLFYTNNGGITWNSVEGGNFKSVEFEPGNPNVAYATTAAAGYYRSTNGGQTFTSITLPSVSGAGRMQLGVTPAAPNYVYVFADNATNYAFFGIWLSTDTGKTFTRESTTPNVLGFENGTGSDATQGQGWYTLSIAVSPTSATTLVVGGVNIWESTNSGASWTRLTSWTGGSKPYVHADIHGLTYLPGSGTTIYAGDDGGVHYTTNSGTSWTDISNGLEIAEQYSIGLSASNANEWITGWQDNGTNLANSTWSEVIGGDGMMCFIDQTNNNYMYGETFDAGFEMSSNGGGGFSPITTGLTETGGWVTPWLLDPTNDATVFAGLNNVWKSTSRGSGWTKISTFNTGTATIDAITVAPSNDQYIYASETTAIYATTDGGTNWNNVTGNLPAASAAITRIAVDPNNPLRVWVTMSGYSAPDKVFVSTTGGTTWTSISNGLPNLPVNCIVYAGGGIDAMYAGTDMGVYYRDTTNTGGDWVAYNSGLPNVIISDLKIYAAGSILRASTYGRGTWQIALYQPATSAPTANFTAFPTSLCATNTVQFTDASSNEPTNWSWTFTGGTPDTSTQENPIITYNTAGTYPVSMTAKNGNGSNTINVTSYITVNPLPPSPVITQTGNTLSCNPSGYPFYQWYKSGTIIPGATSYQYTVSAKGVYLVKVSDSNGCTSSSSIAVNTVGINEISLNDYIDVYPNPTSGNLQVAFDLPAEGDYEISIADVLGQTIYSDKLHLSGQYTQNINLSGYSKGVYFLSLKGMNSSGVKKIMVY
ncbi:MAG: VPS10 domain-containing protein [Bacteroidia bacterium]